MPSISRLFFFILTCIATALPVQAYQTPTDVTITFRTDSGEEWHDPEFGEAVSYPGLPSWKFNAATTLKFTFNTTATDGTLLVVLKNKPGAEYGNDTAPYFSPGYVEYMRTVIPLTQPGTPTAPHTITFTGSHIDTTNISWGERLYLGFHAISGARGHESRVEANFNGIQGGSPWIHNLGGGSPAYNFEFVFDPDTPHSELPVPTLAEETGSRVFTDLGLLQDGHTVRGALSKYLYTLKDNSQIPANPFAFEKRVWEQYQVDGSNLTFLEILSSHGAQGSKCLIRAPENLTNNGKRYLVLCRTFDTMGNANMARPSSLAEITAPQSAYLFEVGKDVTKNPANCLAVSHTPTSTPPHGPPSCGLEWGLPGYYRFMPIGSSDFDPLQNPNDIVWIKLKYNSGTDFTFSSPIKDTSQLSSWPEQYIHSDDRFPVKVWWSFVNVYGKTDYQETTTIAYDLFGGQYWDPTIQHFDWDNIPTSITTSPLDLSYDIPTSHHFPHMVGSFWVYNANDLSQHLRLTDAQSQDLFSLVGGLQSMDTLIIPSTVASWGASELRLRMKALWGKDNSASSDGFLVNFGQPNPTNGILKTDINESSVWISGNRFETLTAEGSNEIFENSGAVDFRFLETHTGTPDAQLSWRWEATVAGKTYLWINNSWQDANNYADTWIQLGSGAHGSGQTDTFSSRWLWDDQAGTIQAKSLNDPLESFPFADVGQNNLVAAFFTEPGSQQNLNDIHVRIRVQMTFASHPQERLLNLNMTRKSLAQSFDSLVISGTGQVLSDTGEMDLSFAETHTGQPETQLAWRWETTVGQTTYLWIDGDWEPVTASNATTWIELDSGTISSGGTDEFSSRWHWLPDTGQMKPKARGNGAEDPPLATVTANGPTLVAPFFTPNDIDLLDSMAIKVRVRMYFPGYYEELEQDPVTLTLLQPEPGIEAFSFQIAKTGATPTCGVDPNWLETTDFHARLGNLPRMQFNLTTTGSQSAPVTLRIEKVLTGNTYTQLSCHTLDSNFVTTECTNTPSAGENRQRWWVIETDNDPNQDNLFDLLENYGAGVYRIRLTTEDCNTAGGGNAFVTFTLNPKESFALRIHYRDHIGSSSISRTYTPSLTSVVDNTAPFNLKVGSQSLALYAKTPEWTHYEPFGKSWDNVVSEPAPRYTDHEFDMQTGYNYMKGRYQLPDSGRFNRPDPARDWDWENPSSINLYQYVRNNPINSWDPFGLKGMPQIDEEMEVKAEKPEVEEDEGKWLLGMLWLWFKEGRPMTGGIPKGTKVHSTTEEMRQDVEGIPIVEDAVNTTTHLLDGNYQEAGFQIGTFVIGGVFYKIGSKVVLLGKLKTKAKRIKNQIAAGGPRGVTGSVTVEESLQLGIDFVGPGYRKTSKGLISKDGLRQFRFPAKKSGINPNDGLPWSKTGTVVNFESRSSPGGRWRNNVHLDINND